MSGGGSSSRDSEREKIPGLRDEPLNTGTANNTDCCRSYCALNEIQKELLIKYEHIQDERISNEKLIANIYVLIIILADPCTHNPENVGDFVIELLKQCKIDQGRIEVALLNHRILMEYVNTMKSAVLKPH